MAYGIKVLGQFSAKVVPSLLTYFKTLSIGPAPRIEPATSRSAVPRTADWGNPAAGLAQSVVRLQVVCEQPLPRRWLQVWRARSFLNSSQKNPVVVWVTPF